MIFVWRGCVIFVTAVTTVFFFGFFSTFLGGGVLKWVNQVKIFLQVDSISIKGIYPGYENEKPKKMRLTPDTRDFKCFEIF